MTGQDILVTLVALVALVLVIRRLRPVSPKAPPACANCALAQDAPSANRKQVAVAANVDRPAGQRR